MTTPPGLNDFTPIQYEPENPDQRTVTVASSEPRHAARRFKPYSRTCSTSEVAQSTVSSMASGSLISSGGDKKRAKKLTMGDLSTEERVAIKWARKRLLMDLLTTVVWMHNESDENKRAYHNEILYQANGLFQTNLVLTKELITLMNQSVTQFRSSLMEVVDQCADEFNIKPSVPMSDENRIAYMVNRRLVLLDSSEKNQWNCFLHRMVFNVASDSEMLLVFGSETLEKIILLHLYASTYTPLRDEKFLKELNTTTPHMFSHVAVGVEYMIDRTVEDAAYGKTTRFLGDRYAPRQLAYYKAVELALSLPLHKETLPAQFLNLHQRGLHILRSKSCLLSPEQLIHVPATMDQLLRPRQLEAGTSINGSGPHLQSSSASAMLQEPVQEQHTAQYMTGDPYGPEYYEPVYEDAANALWSEGLRYTT